MTIGGRPILSNIMNVYPVPASRTSSSAADYKLYVTEEYVSNHLFHTADMRTTESTAFLKQQGALASVSIASSLSPRSRTVVEPPSAAATS